MDDTLYCVLRPRGDKGACDVLLHYTSLNDAADFLRSNELEKTGEKHLKEVGWGTLVQWWVQ
jgi:hypothetical protein